MRWNRQLFRTQSGERKSRFPSLHMTGDVSKNQPWFTGTKHNKRTCVRHNIAVRHETIAIWKIGKQKLLVPSQISCRLWCNSHSHARFKEEVFFFLTTFKERAHFRDFPFKCKYVRYQIFKSLIPGLGEERKSVEEKKKKKKVKSVTYCKPSKCTLIFRDTKMNRSLIKVHSASVGKEGRVGYKTYDWDKAGPLCPAWGRIRKMGSIPNGPLLNTHTQQWLLNPA